MAIILLTKNVNPDMFSLLVDKYGPPKDVSTENDKKDGISSIYFNIPGIDKNEYVQIIGLINEDGTMELSNPMLMYRNKNF